MVLAGLVALAVVTQVVIAKSWIEEGAATFYQALIWYAISILNVVAVGRSLAKLFLWLYMTKLRSRIYAAYRNWGMEKEVDNQFQAWLNLGMLPLLAFWSLWTIPAVMIAAAPVIAESIGFLDKPRQLVLVGWWHSWPPWSGFSKSTKPSTANSGTSKVSARSIVAGSRCRSFCRCTSA